MIKVNELRIGNLILLKNEFRNQIREIDFDEFKCIHSFDKETYEGCEEFEENSPYYPIPLSEEWLVKFGFELNKTGYTKIQWMFGRHFNIIVNEKKEFLLGYSFLIEKPMYIGVLTYVHQLQNIYFALTGEELTLK